MENPKLTVDLRHEDGTRPAQATVALYEKNRDPMLDSAPLLRKDFGGHRMVLQPVELDRVLGDRDTVLDFNVVLFAGERESFVAGFRYRRQGEMAGFSYLPPDGSGEQGRFGSVSATATFLKAVKDYPGKLGSQGASLGLDYVFIPGSPYRGTVSGQDFVLPKLAAGRYDILAADTSADTSAYFRSVDSLNTADTAFAGDTWGGIIFIPE